MGWVVLGLAEVLGEGVEEVGGLLLVVFAHGVVDVCGCGGELLL